MNIRPRFMYCRTSAAVALVIIGVGVARADGPPGPGPADPLPSWNEGPAKRAVLDFVAAVTREGVRSSWPRPTAAARSAASTRRSARPPAAAGSSSTWRKTGRPFTRSRPPDAEGPRRAPRGGAISFGLLVG